MARFKGSTCAKRSRGREPVFAAQHLFGAESSHAIGGLRQIARERSTEGEAQRRSEPTAKSAMPKSTQLMGLIAVIRKRMLAAPSSKGVVSETTPLLVAVETEREPASLEAHGKSEVLGGFDGFGFVQPRHRARRGFERHARHDLGCVFAALGVELAHVRVRHQRRPHRHEAHRGRRGEQQTPDELLSRAV